MSVEPGFRGLIFRSGMYRIRVAGRLNPEWSERLAGMTVTVVEGKDHTTTTELTGVLQDQAALMGVLEQLYNCGAPLLEVVTCAPENRSR